jgi:hypothetical protein
MLGLIWETSKDIPFSTNPTFIGLEWDLQARTISLPQRKRDKYITAITEWIANQHHTLEDVRKLHGKLTHATLVFPHGRAYQMELKAMLALFGSEPFKPRTAPRSATSDLTWWIALLRSN